MRTKLQILMVVALMLALVGLPAMAGDKKDDMRAEKDDKNNLFDDWFDGWFASGFYNDLDDAEPYQGRQWKDVDSGIALNIPAGWQAYVVDDNLVAVKRDGLGKGEMHHADDKPMKDKALEEKPARGDDRNKPMMKDDRNKPKHGDAGAQKSSDKRQAMKEHQEMAEKPHHKMAVFSVFVEGKGNVFEEYPWNSLSEANLDELRDEVADALQEESGADKVNLSSVDNATVSGYDAVVLEGTMVVKKDEMEAEGDGAIPIRTRLYLVEADDEVYHVLYAAPANQWNELSEFADNHIQSMTLAKVQVKKAEKARG